MPATKRQPHPVKTRDDGTMIPDHPRNAGYGARAKLPARYSARQLVAVAAWFKANPNGIGTVNEYAGRDYTARQWFAWFRSKLMDKINARDPRFPTGRKSQPEYQTELYRLTQYVGTRLVCRPTSLNWKLLGEDVRAAMEHRFPDPE